MRPGRSSTTLAVLLSLMLHVPDGLGRAQEQPPVTIDVSRQVRPGVRPGRPDDRHGRRKRDRHPPGCRQPPRNVDGSAIPTAPIRRTGDQPRQQDPGHRWRRQGRAASGTSPRARSGPSSRGTTARSPAWPSRATASPSPRGAGIRPPWCGTSQRGRAGHARPAHQRRDVGGVLARWQDARHRLDRLDGEGLGPGLGQAPAGPGWAPRRGRRGRVRARRPDAGDVMPRRQGKALGHRRGIRADRPAGARRAGRPAGVPARRPGPDHGRVRRVAPPLGPRRRPLAGPTHPGAWRGRRGPRRILRRHAPGDDRGTTAA